jgi:hypothetical protein
MGTKWSRRGWHGFKETEEEMTEATNDDKSLATDNELPRRDNIGGLCGRSPRALQSCASFLNGRPSYLLYFWEVADAHQILQSSLQRLHNTVGAANSSCAPSAVSSAKRRRRSGQEGDSASNVDSSSFVPLVESIKDLAKAQRQMILDRAEDRIYEVQLEEQRHQSEGVERRRAQVFRCRAELMLDLARKYRKLSAKLNPIDEHNKRLSEFYTLEGCLLKDEIQELEREHH